MPLENILERHLVSCPPDYSIEEVAEIMKEENVGAVVVVEDGKPLGIVTDRDLVLRCLAERMDCSQTSVDRIMSRSVETASVHDGIYDVVGKMRNGAVRRIPVVEDDGKAVGLLSFEDVFELIADEITALRSAIQPERPKIVNQSA